MISVNGTDLHGDEDYFSLSISYHNIGIGNTINQENDYSQRAFLSCFYDYFRMLKQFLKDYLVLPSWEAIQAHAKRFILPANMESVTQQMGDKDIVVGVYHKTRHII